MKSKDELKRYLLYINYKKFVSQRAQTTTTQKNFSNNNNIDFILVYQQQAKFMCAYVVEKFRIEII